MNIETWQERWETLGMHKENAIQAEIDELRAALNGTELFEQSFLYQKGKIEKLQSELAGWKEDRIAYEELRQAIDGSSESMTHEDALAAVKYWQAEICALKDTLQDVRGHYERACQERDSLKAQEPVGSVTVSPWRGLENIEWQQSAAIPEGTHMLFLAAGAQPAQQEPLTDEQIWKNDGIMAANSGYGASFQNLREVVRAVEAAQGIKEQG